METREFAERVLFSSSLEEKLAEVRDLTDHAPGEALPAPGEPGRPAGLRLRPGGLRAGFPGEARLIDEEQRGILLHFFANHELLATELMALVLLKFPDAPAPFRRGIVHTLREEQQHTKWYLRRMEECGVSFGAFPLSRFFWDSIAPMETPLDYVTRLSLTFEQANLDYARHYAAVLREAGDEKTAKILSRIYHDEINHVGYGLRWFRRWKEEGTSDWDAYRRQLHFPLSPARGRGNVPFNVEGRRLAGLDDAFIREIEVFSQSKGRTPNILWFTPDAEAAMASGMDGKGFAPRAGVRALQRDLEILPAFLCHRDDVVLLHHPPSGGHRRKLHAFGFELPECEILDEHGRIPADSLLRARKLHDMRPWAWCPQSAALLDPLDPREVAIRWTPAIRQLFAKDWQVENLGIDSAVCRTPQEIGRAARAFQAQGYTEALAKSPFGAAGQKNRKFPTGDPGALHPWAGRVLARQGALVIEPWFDRVFDFSVQYERNATGLHRRAFVHLENDRRGQFRACTVRPKFCRGLSPDLIRFLMDGPLDLYEKEIPRQLDPHLRAANHTGPVGIDAFVYRAPNGALGHRPIVEVNPRFTMGRLTWELARRVAPGRTVRFELIRAEDPRQKIRDIESARPTALNSAGRITSGCLVLNEARSVLALLTVGWDPPAINRPASPAAAPGETPAAPPSRRPPNPFPDRPRHGGIAPP